MKLKDGTPIKFVKPSEVGDRPHWFVWKGFVDQKRTDLYDLPDSVVWFHHHPIVQDDEKVFYCAVINAAEDDDN